jgi:hypothetical protein
MDNVKWITKKDENGENKHIPIRPRKPFGVTREKALREVEKLREMGLRARLIETNRKHKLYAPYEATIGTGEKPNEKMLYYLGFINDKGEPIISKNEIYDFDKFIKVEGGKIFLIKDRTSPKSLNLEMIKIIPNVANLEDGDYNLDYNDFSKEFEIKKLDGKINVNNSDELFKYGQKIYLDSNKINEIKKVIENIYKEQSLNNPKVLIKKEPYTNIEIEFYKDIPINPNTHRPEISEDNLIKIKSKGESNSIKITPNRWNKEYINTVIDLNSFYEGLNLLTKNNEYKGIEIKTLPLRLNDIRIEDRKFYTNNFAELYAKGPDTETYIFVR